MIACKFNIFHLILFVFLNVKSVQQLKSQSDSVQMGFTLDFTIDSSLMPKYCFISNVDSGVECNWMFYSKIDLKKAKEVKFLSNYQSKSPSVCNDFRDSLGEYWVCLMVNNNELKDTVCRSLNHRFIVGRRNITIFTVYKNEKDSID